MTPLRAVSEPTAGDMMCHDISVVKQRSFPVALWRKPGTVETADSVSSPVGPSESRLETRF